MRKSTTYASTEYKEPDVEGFIGFIVCGITAIVLVSVIVLIAVFVSPLWALLVAGCLFIVGLMVYIMTNGG